MDIKSRIREIENFPKEGINFKDITTLLKDSDYFKYAVDKNIVIHLNLISSKILCFK